MRKAIKKLAVLSAAGILSAVFSAQAFSMAWVGTGTHYKALRDQKDIYMNANGTTSKNLGTTIYGWVKGNNGYMYYTDLITGFMFTGWHTIDGDTYYFLPSDGRMVTGWQAIGNHWYYFSEYGTLQTGWMKIGNYTYYASPKYGYALEGSNIVDGERIEFAYTGNPYGYPQCAMITTADKITGTARDTKPDDLALRNQLLTYLNAHRKNAGLPLLKENAQLNAAAKQRATELLKLYGHKNAYGKDYDVAITNTGYTWSVCAECISRGQKDAGTVSAEWIEGGDTRDDILDKCYNDIGVWVTRDGTDIYYEVLLASTVPAGMKISDDDSTSDSDKYYSQIVAAKQ